MADLNKLAEEIVGLTLLEAQELKTILRDKYGIEPAAGAAVMAVGADDSQGPGEQAEEQTEFDVIIKAAGSQKVPVIKEIRAITGLGLKEAKTVAESPGKPIKEAVSKEEAEEIKSKLEAFGAEIEIR